VLLGLLLLTAVGFFCWHKWWRDPHARLRRAALRELREIGARDDDGPVIARAIEDLMRRYALAVFGRERVARLAGNSWLGFVAGEAGMSMPREADAPAAGTAMSASREAGASTPRDTGMAVPGETGASTSREGHTSAASDAGNTLLAAAFGNSPHDQRNDWIATADAFVRRSARKRKPRARSAA
jgi:hypothetical protein